METLKDLRNFLVNKAIAPGTPHYNELWQGVKKWHDDFEKGLRELLEAENQNYETASYAKDLSSNLGGCAHAHGRRKLIKQILGE